MDLTTLRNADAIVRVDPGDRRTPQRTACADWIEEHIIDDGQWPLPITKIAELSREDAAREDTDLEKGWSRQHITNVLDYYFAPQQHHDVDVAESLQVDIQIPATVENRDDYLRGYLDGLRDNL